jgi:DNA-directed RNA polymerase subunit M/transcription elongation factor TFIIS
MEQKCPRCNQLIKNFDSGKKVCDRCRDVMEFGYPSFAAYRIEDDQEQEPTKRMEISEGWTLPAYFTARRK